MRSRAEARSLLIVLGSATLAILAALAFLLYHLLAPPYTALEAL